MRRALCPKCGRRLDRQLRAFGFAGACLLLAGAVSASPAAAAPKESSSKAKDAGGRARPDVLFIAIDDLNDWIGPLGGHPQSRTPNLDRLARRGTVFTRAYCSAPACNPSRASLLCGIRPSTSGVYRNSQPWRRGLPRAVTLPRWFLENGYRVLGCGKIFHGAYPDPDSWHEYFKRPADPVPPKRPANGIAGTAHFDWGPVDVPDERMGDHQVVDWAIEKLRSERGRPLFLAVGLFRPHLPWYVPRKYFKPFPAAGVKLPEVPADDLDDIPPAGLGMARPQGDHRRVTESHNWRKAVSAYLASIAYADQELGRLLDALDATGRGRDTIIVLWGDHGWHLGEKQHWRKFALWEEATRVPFFFVAPGVTRPASRCERTVSLLDLYPTLIELCGLPKRGELEGRSLVPLLRDPGEAREQPVVTTYGYENHAVRSERWRYIRYADGSEELYDHSRDPMEWKNLASDPDLASVKEDLARWLPEVNAKPVPRGRARSAGRKRASRGRRGAKAPR